MTKAVKPDLKPGRVYRTSQLAAWSANAPRLAKRLVRDGELLPFAHGLYVHPAKSRFGPVPADDHELMRAFLNGEPFVLTGPYQWNALGLGTTALHAMPMVYNTQRSGVFKLGQRTFNLRRVAFPREPTPEWYVIDLFEHADQAGTQPEALEKALGARLGQGQFDRVRLQEMAKAFGSKKTFKKILKLMEETTP